MFVVDTVSPPTETCDPWLKITPFGFTRKTLPLEVSEPKIDEGFAVTTLFNTVDEADGWLKRVVSPAPMLNPCQLMIVLFEFTTVSVLPLVENDALPAATAGPVGLAYA